MKIGMRRSVWWGVRCVGNVWAGRAIASTLWCAGLLFAGCSQDPRGLLDRMSEAYRAADRYSDDGRVLIQYKRGDVEVDHALPFRVAFERPDRIRIECYDAQVVSDGTNLRAAVGDVPGQVLVEPIESPLSLEQLFTDPHLRSRLSEGEAGCPTQLPLLLADDTVSLILSESLGNPRLSGQETIDGHRCTKVEVDKPDGTLTLWIDEATSILRRLSLPTAAYAAFLSVQVGPVSGVKVVADFKGASFASPGGSEAFAFEMPKAAREVTALEPLQAPDPPSELIGKAAPPFTLKGLDGTTVSRESLAGRLAVIEFFFDGCGPCKRTMPLVRKAVGSLREKGRDVSHHHVSVDDTDVTDETVRAAVEEAGGNATILRDPRSVAAAAFDLTSFPAVVVLAPDGAVADLQRGPNDRIGDDLIEIAEAIANGTPTSPIVQKRFDRRLTEYRSAVNLAAGRSMAALPEALIAPRRQPDRFKLVRVWRNDDVAMPGNIVRIDPPKASEGEQPRLVVLDGWRSVVVLDSAGKEVARHDLDIPKDAVIGFLRTSVDRDGRRWWLGGSVGGQHVFVFDASWNLKAAYPELGSGSHAGISAAELVDGDGDGSPEIVVGYFGTVGVQGASLDGNRIWKERSVETVIHMAADAADADGRRGVVVVDGRGRLVRISHDGVAGSPVDVSGRRIQAIFGAPVGISSSMEPTWALLGIAGESLGKTALIGIAGDLSPRWDRPLPDGIHRDGPIEPVSWADLLGSGRRQWLVAGADGSVSVLWDDGGMVDRYAHGEPIVGLSGFVAGGTPYIVIATRSAVEAMRMEDIALD